MCAISTYVVHDHEELPHCMPCPIGARCETSDACALQMDNLTCPGTNVTEPHSIVGEWVQKEKRGEYQVKSCPAGYSRINSLDGTSNGVFFHEAQQCRKCLPGRHYILHPNNDTCQRCPPGPCSRVVPYDGGEQSQ